MEIMIRGRKIDLPDDVRDAVQGKVARLARQLDTLEIARAEIELEELGYRRTSDRERCEITVVGRGQVLRVSATAEECLVAVDRAVGKLEHRVEKLKGRLDQRSNPGHKSRNRRAEAILAPEPAPDRETAAQPDALG